MYGDDAQQSSGQLAVLDAVVFFSVAILISAAVLGLPKSSHQVISGDLTPSAAEVLDSVLSASIGVNVTVETDHVVRLGSRTLVRESLAFEAGALFRGDDADRFAVLNSRVMTLFDSCAPVWTVPYLLIVYKSLSEPLLALPGLPDREGWASASSARLALDGAVEVLVVLVLCPAFPSENSKV